MDWYYWEKISSWFSGRWWRYKRRYIVCKIWSKECSGNNFWWNQRGNNWTNKGYFEYFWNGRNTIWSYKKYSGISYYTWSIIIASKHFYTENGMVDIKTAKGIKILRNIVEDMKNNLNTIEKEGIPITPSKMSIIKKCLNLFLYFILC